MGLAEVSSVLWHERELLDLLLFKLEQEQLLIANSRPRWLGRATHEVEIVLAEIRAAELRRAVEVDGVAAELGLHPGPSLATLTNAVPDPWQSIFEDHRRSFLEATAEIQSLANANRDLLTSSYRKAREALASLGTGTREEVSAYSPTGARVTAPTRPTLLNEVL